MTVKSTEGLASGRAKNTEGVWQNIRLNFSTHFAKRLDFLPWGVGRIFPMKKAPDVILQRLFNWCSHLLSAWLFHHGF